MGNLFSLRPDFSKIDKVFASHLHVDHVGDFMGLHIGGWLSGRYTPIHLYGPSGSSPEMGTKAFAEAMKKGLRLGPRHPQRCAAGRRRADRGARVRLQADERDRLSGERRDDSFLAGDSLSGRLGELRSGMERAQVRVRRRYLSEQVVHGVRQRGGRRLARVLPSAEGAGRSTSAGTRPGDLCLDEDPHRASSLRQGDVGSQTAHGRWLPFGAIAGEQRRDHGWRPQDL